MPDTEELPTLTAPDDLYGPVHRRTPQHLKDKRTDWINVQRLCGYTDAQIAQALGVSPSSIAYYMSRRQMGRRFFMAKYG